MAGQPPVAQGWASSPGSERRTAPRARPTAGQPPTVTAYADSSSAVARRWPVVRHWPAAPLPRPDVVPPGCSVNWPAGATELHSVPGTGLGGGRRCVGIPRVRPRGHRTGGLFGSVPRKPMTLAAHRPGRRWRGCPSGPILCLVLRRRLTQGHRPRWRGPGRHLVCGCERPRPGVRSRHLRSRLSADCLDHHDRAGRAQFWDPGHRHGDAQPRAPPPSRRPSP